MRRTYPLIAGGGPAGSTAAILLARGGAEPLLLERSRDVHDVVCGGFLGADAIRLLDHVGVDPFALGAHRIDRLRLIVGDRVIETPLPFAAAGLSRRTLDAALIDQAAQAGAKIERGVVIRQIDPVSRRIELADRAAIESDGLFLATGKHDVRGTARPPGAAGPDPAIGIRTMITASPKLTQSLDGVIELHLFRHGYAGLLLQEDGCANLCLSVAQSHLKAAGGRPDDLMTALAAEAPRLLDRFAARTSSDWSTIARIPYGWRASGTQPGLFRLGDQAAVIASLAGDGVAIALASAQVAASAFLSGGSAAATDFQKDFHRTSRRAVMIAETIRRTGEHPVLAGPLMALLRRGPGLIRLIASATRIG